MSAKQSGVRAGGMRQRHEAWVKAAAVAELGSEAAAECVIAAVFEALSNSPTGGPAPLDAEAGSASGCQPSPKAAEDERALRSALGVRIADWRGFEAMCLAKDPLIRSVVGPILRGNALDADEDDVCQEVKIRLWRALCSGKASQDIERMLMEVARNVTLNYVRYCHAQKRGAEKTDSLEALTEDLGFEASWAGMSPDEVLVSKERVAALDACMRQFASFSRELLELRYLGDLAYDKIALILKVSVVTVNNGLAKARKALRECIGRRLRD